MPHSAPAALGCLPHVPAIRRPPRLPAPGECYTGRRNLRRREPPQPASEQVPRIGGTPPPPPGAVLQAQRDRQLSPRRRHSPSGGRFHARGGLGLGGRELLALHAALHYPCWANQRWASPGFSSPRSGCTTAPMTATAAVTASTASSSDEEDASDDGVQDDDGSVGDDSGSSAGSSAGSACSSALDLAESSLASPLILRSTDSTPLPHYGDAVSGTSSSMSAVSLAFHLSLASPMPSTQQFASVTGCTVASTLRLSATSCTTLSSQQGRRPSWRRTPSPSQNCPPGGGGARAMRAPLGRPPLPRPPSRQRPRSAPTARRPFTAPDLGHAPVAPQPRRRPPASARPAREQPAPAVVPVAVPVQSDHQLLPQQLASAPPVTARKLRPAGGGALEAEEGAVRLELGADEALQRGGICSLRAHRAPRRPPSPPAPAPPPQPQPPRQDTASPAGSAASSSGPDCPPPEARAAAQELHAAQRRAAAALRLQCWARQLRAGRRARSVWRTRKRQIDCLALRQPYWQLPHGQQLMWLWGEQSPFARRLRPMREDEDSDDEAKGLPLLAPHRRSRSLREIQVELAAVRTALGRVDASQGP